jgi:hypothetical protein
MLPDLTGFTWNKVAKRYRDNDTGRFVSNKAVRDGLESTMDLSALQMNNLTQKLIDGGISLADWQSGMMSQIKNSHVAASALSQGGWAQMTQSDWGATGQLIRAQYDYLRNFASQIASGEQALDGRALIRSDMYGDAANGTFAEMQRRAQIIDGMEEERRVLEDSINACDGCLEQAALGWQPIGTLDPIGGEECTVRCRCEFEYRKQDENGEWVEA